jgi:hypothetical protein
MFLVNVTPSEYVAALKWYVMKEEDEEEEGAI